VLFGAITAFWLFPFGLRLRLPYVPLALASVQILLFSILWGCYQYGGLSSPLMPWMITVPLLAFFYLGMGRAVQAGVLTMILADLSIFYWLSDGGQHFPQAIPPSQLTALGIISTLSTAAYVSMMALYYSSVVNSQSELEREVALRLETAEALRAATRKADQANRAKSDFLAKMSHELRTPLNAVIGYSDMLLEDAEASARTQQCSDLEKIRNAGHRLLALINDLLELSKLDAGKMQLFAEAVELPRFFAEVAAGAEPAVLSRGNTFALDIPADLGCIEADTAKLRAAIANLLDNAAKFTREGRVTLSVRRRQSELRIAVSDTGCGIEPRRMAKLFENFDEDDAATTSQYGGTGLGLALSRKLCRLMDGELTVHSDLGRGSTFTICLPVSPAGETADQAAARTDYAARRAASRHARPCVLVIDDDPAVLDLAQRLLEREGYTTLIAAGGFEGIEFARAQPPSLILLDVLMPELNGWQVLRALREHGATAGCPVVMMTNGTETPQGRQLGAQGHLSKPIEAATLLQTIERLLSPAPDALAA
jgi:signal transduction histidine kinase/ActR/RegA family two-component response regulator